MEYQKLIEKKQEDLIWDFANNTLPYFNIYDPLGNYAAQIKVDPFPCMAHDNDLLGTWISKIEHKFPIGTILQWVNCHFEIAERTNAWAQRGYIYDNTERGIEIKEKHKMTGLITFSGKRTIIHPAMTKYLVAHEYGHQVEYWIGQCMQDEGNNDHDVFRKQYAEFRGVPFDMTYGGGRWKNNIQEIIADDFRVAFVEVDTSFYVHDAVPHPLVDSKVKDYWQELYEKYKFVNDGNRSSKESETSTGTGL